MSLAVVRDTLPSRHHRHVDVRSVVEELRRQSPRAGVDRLAGALAERIEEDRALLLDACTVLVRQTLSTIETTRRRRHQNGKTPEERSQRRSVATAEVKQLAARVKGTVLLDLLMPNGIAMRYCSGTQMAGFGSAYRAIGERVGDAMVGEILVESQIRELLDLGDQT